MSTASDGTSSPGPGTRPTVAITVPTVEGGESLSRLLRAVAREVEGTTELADVSVVVVDNAPRDDTKLLVEQLASETGLDIGYHPEPTPGIPAARNACIRMAASADALIFLDDDEWPAEGWLEALLHTWRETGADIVLGPARGVLPDGSPRWAVRSGVFTKDRRLPTGAPIRTAYSYNTLVAAPVLAMLGDSFDDIFRHTGSSDRHYFTRASRAGFRSVWCAEALVYEEIPPSRVTVRWLTKRGFRTGGGAAITLRLLSSRWRALPRVVALVVANIGYGVVQVVGTLHPRLSWVEGLRRFSIAAGLIAAVFGITYDEYRRREQRARPARRSRQLR